MNINLIKKTLTTAVCKSKHYIVKHSPEILAGVGTITGAAAIGFTIKSTAKSVDFLKEVKETIEDAHKTIEELDVAIDANRDNGTLSYNLVSNKESVKTELSKLYVSTGIHIMKEYALPLFFAGMSTACFFSSLKILRSWNSTLKNQNAALVASNAAFMSCFTKYRDRVIEKYGKDVDEKLLKGEKEEVIQTKDPETGEVKEEVKMVSDSADPFSWCFDEFNSKAWTRDPEINLFYIRGQKSMLNRKLKEQGYLFLNDALLALGFDPVSYGQVYGWVYDPDNPNHIGDSVVSLGFDEDFKKNDEQEKAFLEGYEKSVWINFNVDGPIIDDFTKYAV